MKPMCIIITVHCFVKKMLLFYCLIKKCKFRLQQFKIIQALIFLRQCSAKKVLVKFETLMSISMQMLYIF